MSLNNNDTSEMRKGIGKSTEVDKKTIEVPMIRTSRLAIVSIFCAVTAILLIFLDLLIMTPDVGRSYLTFIGVFLGGLSFVLGFVSRTIIAINKGKVKGLAYLIIAIVLGTPFILFIASGVYVNWNRARSEKPGKARILGFAILEYAKEESGGYLPDAETWCDTVLKYNKTVYESAFSYRSSEPGVYNYAFNRNLSGLKLDMIPKNTVLIFESEGGWNLSGTEELLFKAPKKRQYVHTYCGSADIRPIHVQDEAYKSVHWKP